MKKALIVAAIILASVSAYAQSTYQPRDIEVLNSSAVYSICQDKYGAMWFNSSTGVFRYNGSELEFVHDPLIMRQFATGDNYIYAPTSRSLFRFDVRNVTSSRVPFPENSKFAYSAMATKGDSLYVSVENRIYLWDGESTSLLREMEQEVSALLSYGDSLFIGTADGWIHLLENGSALSGICSFPSKVTALSLFTEGKLLAGLNEGGFYIINPADRSICGHSAQEARVVRSFSVSQDGEIFIGSVSGAYRYNLETNELNPLKFSGEGSLPICCVFTDSDSNLWTGTYYNGVYYSYLSYPFTELTFPSSAKAVRALAEDSEGSIWAATDNYGIYFKRKGQATWSHLPESDGIKFQGVDYDRRTNSLWMGEYQGDLYRYDLSRQSFTKYEMPSRESVLKVTRKEDDLYLGGRSALYVFNPEKEASVSRSRTEFGNNISDICLDADGNLVVAGNGLRVLQKDSVKVIFEQGLCSSLYVCKDGTILGAVISKGLAEYKDGQLKWIDSPSHFIAKSGVSVVCQAGEDCLLLGSRNGLALMRLSDCSIMSYSRLNGLGDSAASVKSLLLCNDGSILISCFNGIMALNNNHSVFDRPIKRLKIDNCFVNGSSRRNLPWKESFTLAPGESNFSFSLADFDYSHSQDVAVRWRLTGYDSEWKNLNGSNNLGFMNMKHGKYSLELEMSSGSTTEVEIFPVILKPFWYQTILARIIFALLALATLSIIFFSTWSRAVLSEKLRLREKENEDRIKFFRDLSLELRTPLNLIVGQLEKYFHDYGSRTKGVEDLESIYLKSKTMQGLISDFVDEQSESTPVDVAGAHFLNAATGVVERHLFSGDLDVQVLCEELNMGKTKLSQEMRRICGMSPREFIEDIRMRHADEMLRGGQYRVAEVSDRLGFSSPRYFLQRYKAKFGHAPSKQG